MPQQPNATDYREILFEIVLAGLCSAVWILVILDALGWLSLAGKLSLGLYRFFSIAAILGWLIGNICVYRQRNLSIERYRKRAILLYVTGPPSFLFAAQALAPLAEQQQAPLAPLLGLGIYGIFFLLPLTLKPPKLERRR